MNINVCIGSACHLKGSYEVIQNLKSTIAEMGLQDAVSVSGSFCLGECQKAVAVKLEDDDRIYSVSPENAKSFFVEIVMPKLR